MLSRASRRMLVHASHTRYAPTYSRASANCYIGGHASSLQRLIHFPQPTRSSTNGSQQAGTSIKRYGFLTTHQREIERVGAFVAVVGLIVTNQHFKAQMQQKDAEMQQQADQFDAEMKQKEEMWEMEKSVHEEQLKMFNQQDVEKIVRAKLSTYEPTSTRDQKYVPRDGLEEPMTEFFDSKPGSGMFTVGTNSIGKTFWNDRAFMCADVRQVTPNDVPESWKMFEDSCIVHKIDIKGIITGQEILSHFEAGEGDEAKLGKIISDVIKTDYPNRNVSFKLYVHLKTHDVFTNRKKTAELFDSIRLLCENVSCGGGWYVEFSMPFNVDAPTGFMNRSLYVEFPLWTSDDILKYAVASNNEKYLDVVQREGALKKIAGRVGLVEKFKLAERGWGLLKKELKSAVASHAGSVESLNRFYDTFFRGWDGVSVVQCGRFSVEDDWKEFFPRSIYFESTSGVYVCQDRLLKNVLDEVLSEAIPEFTPEKIPGEEITVSREELAKWSDSDIDEIWETNGTTRRKVFKMVGKNA